MRPKPGATTQKKHERRRVLIAVGTRPEAIKLAPVVAALRAEPWADVRVLATGQHRELLDEVLAFFGIRADIDLDVMSPDQTLADLSRRLLPAIDAVLTDQEPGMVVAQGDTTSALMTALASFHRGIPFAHVEAGLRTGDRREPFPEECNRVLIAQVADLHFAPTEAARTNLLAEQVDADAIEVVGNTGIDALLWTAQRDLPDDFANLRRPLVLVTAHRSESFGAPLAEICEAVGEIASARDVDFLWPVHPNPRVREPVEAALGSLDNVRLVAPLDYPHFVAAMRAAALILTDSGGVQEEAPSLGKPVLVLRDKTERGEGIASGNALLVGLDRARIVKQTLRLLDDRAAYEAMAHQANPYGDGQSAPRIAACVAAVLQVRC